MGYQSAIVAVTGEFLAAAGLRQADWPVSDTGWKGGSTEDLDLIATSADGTVTIEVQVKTTTAADGRISWQKPGRPNVDPWIRKAEARGHHAVFILIQADESSVRVEPDPGRGGFFVPDPRILQMTAMTARTFGDLADRRRAEYGRRRRQRLYRGKGVVGEPLSPDRLRYPVYVDDGDELEAFLRRLKRSRGTAA